MTGGGSMESRHDRFPSLVDRLDCWLARRCGATNSSVVLALLYSAALGAIVGVAVDRRHAR